MYKANEAINGTFGVVWWDDKKLAATKSFEAKLKFSYDTITMPEELGESYKLTGYSISGTLTGTKFDSFWLRKYADAMRKGVVEEVTVVGRVKDPASRGYERIALHGVVIDELTLLKFENKKLVEEEIPFKARSYEPLDLMPE